MVRLARWCFIHRRLTIALWIVGLVVAVAASVAAGGRARPLAAPDLVIRGAGRVGDLARRLGADPMLTSGKVREILHRDWSVAPGERLAGAPAPLHDLAGGFADTVAAYRAQGWLAPIV